MTTVQLTVNGEATSTRHRRPPLASRLVARDAGSHWHQEGLQSGLAVMHDGAEIVTIEGLAKEEELHPLQAALHLRPIDPAKFAMERVRPLETVPGLRSPPPFALGFD